MKTKLLSAVLLASTALAGVASADPVIRDHRYNNYDSNGSYQQQPAATTYR